jgi:hypothetical protein
MFYKAMKATLIALMTLASSAFADDGVTEQKVRALIEELAISQHAAAPRPFEAYNDSGELERTSGARYTERVRPVYAAASEIERLGFAAFPYLMEHFEDARQSVAFRRVMPSTVGDACRCIIMRQVYALPEGYSQTASLFRKGADGELHEQPVWSRQIYEGVGVRQWLTDRKGRTLQDMQIEALEWVLEIQKSIGTRTKSERDEYIAPLETQLTKLKRKAEPGGAANGGQPDRTETNRTPPAAGSSR